MVLRNMLCLLKNGATASGFGETVIKNLDFIGQCLLHVVENHHHGVHWYADNEIKSFELMRKMIPIAYSGYFLGQAQQKFTDMIPSEMIQAR